jgi:hypothetical protein
MEPTAGISFLARVDSYLHNFYDSFGVRQASCPMGIVVRKPEREADHSIPSSAKVENCGATFYLPNTSSRHAALLLNTRETFHLSSILLNSISGKG